MKSFRAIAASAVGMLAFGGLAYAASPAQAAANLTGFSHGQVEYASNTGLPGLLGSGDTAWFRSSSPLSYSQSSQQVTPGGVNLTVDPSNGYADSGVIVPLGTVADLGCTGTSLPSIVFTGSGSLAVNLYEDTSGNRDYFSWNNAIPQEYAGKSGDNYFLNVDAAAPSCASIITDENSSEGSATEVWAWVGIDSSTNGHPVTASVFSVDGRRLTITPPSRPAPPAAASEISSFTDYSASCLTASALANAPVQLWTCGVRAQDQNFGFADVGGNQVLESLTNHHSGNLCVTTPAGAGQLRLDPCTGDANQVVLKQGPFYVFTGDSDYVMDDAAWNTADGAQVIAYPANGGRNQKWSLP